jgi:uncharacterized protein (TIGR00369 family)
MALNGLEQLQAMIATGGRPPIADLLLFDLVEASDGRAVFQATPGMHAYNPIGSVHGGYTATLLDSACGCAVHSKLSPEQAYTTLELKVSYHRALTHETGVVRVSGLVLSFGKRVAFAEAKLHDSAGRLCASATSTLLIFDRRT